MTTGKDAENYEHEMASLDCQADDQEPFSEHHESGADIVATAHAPDEVRRCPRCFAPNTKTNFSPLWTCMGCHNLFLWAKAEKVLKDSHDHVDYINQLVNQHFTNKPTTQATSSEEQGQTLSSVVYIHDSNLGRSNSTASTETIKPIKKPDGAALPASSINQISNPCTHTHKNFINRDHLNNAERAIAAEKCTDPYRHTYPDSLGCPRRTPRTLSNSGPKSISHTQPIKTPLMNMEAIEAGYAAMSAHSVHTQQKDATRQRIEEFNRMDGWQKFTWHMQCKPCWEAPEGCCFRSEREKTDGTGHGHGDGCFEFCGCREVCCKAGLRTCGGDGCCEGCGCVSCCGWTHGVWKLCDGWFRR